MDIVIRRARPLDYEDMAMIDEKCFAIPWTAESFYRELTQNKIAHYVVAEVGGYVVGYMGLWRVEDEGHITNVAVLPEYREQSVASSMMKELFEACGQNGISDFTLEVRSSNMPARCLYEKFGFRSEGVRPGYYVDSKEDAIIMWRRGK